MSIGHAWKISAHNWPGWNKRGKTWI